MEPWDVELLRRQGQGSLVRVAQAGRLVHEVDGRPLRVDLTWVDETALALCDAAVRKHIPITFVYPAPAGRIGVLLAAQVAIALLQSGSRNQTVGIVTADPGGATRLWRQIRIATHGDRAPIDEVFPVWRSHPNGDPPLGQRRLQGVLIGPRCAKWPVDVTVVDHMAGPVEGTPCGTAIHLFADPLDPAIADIAAAGGLIWGWSDSIIGLWHRDIETAAPGTVPFSVANDRLAAIGDGVTVRVTVGHNEPAAKAIDRLREDLAAMSSLAGRQPPRYLALGLRTAWSHTHALASLPCRPSEYDPHAGLPPRAARATRGFSSEIQAWGDTLAGDLREYASCVASDLSDLRAALEVGNPLGTIVGRAVAARSTSTALMRSRTAVKAFAATRGVSWQDEQSQLSGIQFSWYSRVSSLPVTPSVLAVGAPPRSMWHKLDSGLTRRLDVAVIGENEAKRAQQAMESVRYMRARWASLEFRERVWRALVDDEPPPEPIDVKSEPPAFEYVDGPTTAGRADPFGPLGALFDDDRPLVDGEGPSEQLAREGEGGEWRALVEAVSVVTDEGTLLLPIDEELDLLGDDDEPATRIAADLRVGDRVIIGREAGRVGLLDALESALKHRPDVLVARLLARDFRRSVLVGFAATGVGPTELHRRLRALGCSKTPFAVRSWVTPGGPIAPRDFPDVERLVGALGLDYPQTRLRETFAGISRIRTFRRAAGKALHKAASVAAATADEARVDPETGLSVADLREAVAVVTVRSVVRLDEPVRLGETGRLQ